jgi:response regulator RpfG family c-di-GMP phosphodiesterase
MHFKRRQLLILLLILTQAGCMAFGIIWAAQWLRGAFGEFMHRTVDAQNRSIVFELARRATEKSSKFIEPGSDIWKRSQELCEQLGERHDGIISIVNRNTGALLCDSRLKDDPSLLKKFPGRADLVRKGGVVPMIEAARRAEIVDRSTACGEVEVGGELYYATCLSVPKLGAVIVAHQSQASIDDSVDELVLPVLQVGFVLTCAVIGATSVMTVFLVKRFDSTLATIESSVEKEVDRRTLALTRSRNAVVFGLAKLSESRDKDAAQHLERLRTYVTILATEMAKHHPEIDHHYVANLSIASALHDIGKIAVPDGVILKLGHLTPAERRAMQMHTVLGGECLASVQRIMPEADQFLELGRQVAQSHHEQWDGSGYPQGLQGKDIPLSARIVALADVYDAVTSHRAYRPAISHAEARDWIVSNYGSQFDPEVVEAFVAREGDFAKVSATAVVATAPAAAAPAAVLSASSSPTMGDQPSAMLAANGAAG